MQGYHLFTLIVIATTLFSYLNIKFLKWPSTIAVTVFSLVLSVLLLLTKSGFPHWSRVIENQIISVNFDELVLNVVLGFLLFGAAFRIDVGLFKNQLKIIASLAFFSTLISTFLIGFLVYATFNVFHHPLPFVHCLLFGAVISPTDPVAALGVMQKVGVSRKLEMLITGESLINDGIAIVLFTTFMSIALNQADGNTFLHGGWLFLKEAGGAVIFGFVLGGIAVAILNTVGNYKVEIMITLSLVMGGYTLAQFLGVSSPLAMVVAGLICNRRSKVAKNHISHEYVLTFWEMIEEFANVILFLLIGVELIVIPLNVMLLKAGAIFLVVVLLARYVSVLPVYLCFKNNFQKRSIHLLTWGGLRGAVSIALALAITSDLHRGIFLPITYLIALFSIVIQGLTLKPLSIKLGLDGPGQTED